MQDLHSLQKSMLLNLLEKNQQAILIQGPAGTGKRTLVRTVVAAFPTYLLLEVPKLAIDDARSIRQQCSRRATNKRLFLIDGDNANSQGYNAILKILEEPPSGVTFVVSASKPPLSTIVSRCVPIFIPPLTDKELAAVLADKGMSERAASHVIPYAHGSVAEAYEVYAKFEEKRRLIPFIKALKTRDLPFVFSQVKTINRDDIRLMIELSDDVLLSRYGLVSQDLSTVMPASPDFLLTVKAALLEGSTPALCWLRAFFATG